MQICDELASRFGTLLGDLKRLKYWEKIDFKHLKKVLKIESQIRDLDKKIGILEVEIKRKNIIAKQIMKKRGTKFVGIVSDAAKRSQKHIYPVKEEQEVKKLKSERQKEQQKILCNIQRILKDVEIIQNSIYFTEKHIFAIEIIAKELGLKISLKRLNSFLELLKISLDEENKLVEKINRLEQIVNSRDEESEEGLEIVSLLNKYHEEVTTILEIESSEKVIKEEISELKTVLSKLNEAKVPEDLFTNRYKRFELYATKRAQEALNKDYSLERALFDKLDTIIDMGINQKRTRKSTERWRMLQPDTIRGEMTGGLRVFFDIVGNELIIGDACQHNKQYKNISNKINDGDYSIKKEVELNIVPKYFDLAA